MGYDITGSVVEVDGVAIVVAGVGRCRAAATVAHQGG